MRARLLLPLLILVSACSGGGSSAEQVGAAPAAPGLPPTVPGSGGGLETRTHLVARIRLPCKRRMNSTARF